MFATKAPELPQAPGKDAVLNVVENPKVIVESYEDFVCPHCGSFNAIQKQLIDKYKGQSVRFVFRNYPFLSSYSQTAAEASEYANDKGKFDEYKNRIFDEQNTYYTKVGQEDATFLKTDNLVQWAVDLGLDGVDLKKNLDGRTYKQRVNDEKNRGTDRGVNSTPSIFINNELFKPDASKGTYLDLNSLSKLIDARLAK